MDCFLIAKEKKDESFMNIIMPTTIHWPKQTISSVNIYGLGPESGGVSTLVEMTCNSDPIILYDA